MRGSVPRSHGSSGQGQNSWYFLLFNANKKSITVNLKSERGLELVKNMAKRADVMVENFAPGAIERLGLGYEVVVRTQPGYDQQKSFDDALVKLGLFDFSEYGPPADVFPATLGGAGYTVSGFNLEKRR